MGTPTPAELELTTMADRQVTEAMRHRADSADAARASRADSPGTLGAAPGGSGRILSGGASPETPGAVRYGALLARHPDYLGHYWQECRALYAGGPRLFLDDQVFRRLFPSNPYEPTDIYEARRARAFYIAYPGEIIDNLLAGFASDPLRLSAGANDKGDEEPLPAWWAKFSEDVSPPGGEKLPVDTFAVEWLREAFQTRTAWALVDLPRIDPEALPQTRLEEEQSGALSPYVCMLPAENVLDWQEDEDSSELEWVLCYWRSQPRGSILEQRKLITERWVLWTAEGWATYRITWDPTHPPDPRDYVALEDQGSHDFGCVPIVRLALPEGMYAMGKMHSIAREHLNKRNALSWAEFKALFSQLYEFLGAPGGAAGNFNPAMSPMVGTAAADPERATNQVRGIGWTQVRGQDDDAKYVGPDTAAFKEARESCAEVMRELHRVMFSMALSANMDSAALQRSAESKGADAVSIAVILAKTGEIIRDALGRLVMLVARARGEQEPGIKATGGTKFDAASVAATMTMAVEFLVGIPQRSPTMTKLALYRLYKMFLGDVGAEPTQKDLDNIKDELDKAVTAEALLVSDPSVDPTRIQDPNADDEDEEDDAPPARKPAKAKPGKQRMYP